MVGGGKLQGKKRKTRIQENGAPNKDCSLDPGWARRYRTIPGTPFSHYTRHAKIPRTMHHAFTRFLSYYNSYERNFTIYYGIHPIILEPRNE